MRFRETEKAAKEDRLSRWHLIEAIGVDAFDNDLPIVGLATQVAAREACEKSGLELADATIKRLCITANFSVASDAKQRKVWQRYGWTVVAEFANAGWTPERAYEELAYETISFADARDVIRSDRGRRGAAPTKKPISLDDAWPAWANNFEALMIEGAKLAERTERTHKQLGTYAELAYVIYQRLVQRQIDAELRQLLESEANG